MSDENRTRALLDRYFDRGLSAGDKEELEAILRADEEARATFWERARLHSALRILGQRRRGERIARELEPISTEPPLHSVRAKEVPEQVIIRHPSWTSPSVLALAASIILAAALTWLWPQAEPVARLTDASKPEWHGKGMGRGETVRPGAFHLSSGVAQIEFFTGTKLVVQGPADFKIVGRNAVRLEQGRVSAEVPPPAIGFEVQMPEGKVVDLGTRFGVSVDGSGKSQVHVFKGRVRVERDESSYPLEEGSALAFYGEGPGSATPANELEFPHAASLMTNILPNGGFEKGTVVATSGPPNHPSSWSGDAAAIVGATGGVKPRDGSGMLSFGIANEKSASQWQVVDLEAIRQAAPGLPVEARLSACFNRARTAVSQGTFAITVAAFRGSPDRAPAMWASRSREALALAQQTLTADLDPLTWEQLNAQIVVPPNASYLVVHLAGNWTNDPVSNGTNYVHLSANSDRVMASRLRRKSLSRDVAFNVPAGSVLGQMMHHVVTLDVCDHLWRWYREGDLVATLPDADGIANLDDVNNWLGRSQYHNDANFEGIYREFRIYDRALPADEVKRNKELGPEQLQTELPPRHRWIFAGSPNASAADGTMIADAIKGGTPAIVRGAGAMFAGDGRGISLPGGSCLTQGYIDLPNGVATGADTGKRYTSVSYEFWAQQEGNWMWSRFFDFGIGSAGEVSGAGFNPMAHFADSATLEFLLPPKRSAIE